MARAVKGPRHASLRPEQHVHTGSAVAHGPYFKYISASHSLIVLVYSGYIRRLMLKNKTHIRKRERSRLYHVR